MRARYFLSLLLLLTQALVGCLEPPPQSVVYGQSGRAFTAPDFNSAWHDCMANDSPCRAEQ